jgi:cysteine-rich repeat protein
VGAQGAERTVRVATWNIEKVGDPFYDGDPGTEDQDEEAEFLAALAILQRLDPDVVAINEVSSDTDTLGLELLAATLGYDWVVVPGPNDNRDALGNPIVVGVSGDRNAIISRFPVTVQAFHSPPSLSGDPAAVDTTRLIVSARLDVPQSNVDLTLFSQHWKSGFNDTDEYRRAIESLRVSQAASTLDPATEAFVVLGDFNQQIQDKPKPAAFNAPLTTGMPPIFVLGNDVAALIASQGLASDAFSYFSDLVALPATQLNGNAGTRFASGRRIDYLLVSPGALIYGEAETEVYNSELDVSNTQGLPKVGSPLADSSSLDASDHAIVLADLRLPLEAPCLTPADCIDQNPCTAEQCEAGVCKLAPSTGAPADTCENGVDDDCNGLIDDGCFCASVGDINQSGAGDVADVQCLILLTLWDLGGKLNAPPACAKDPIEIADQSCDGAFSVSDVQIAIANALGTPLALAIDQNGNVCHDACDATHPTTCGDGIVSLGEQCDEGSNNGLASSGCRSNCRLIACGDGTIDASLEDGVRFGEECEDGNATSGDGCSAACALELQPNSASALYFSEVMSNPSAPVDDTVGEWLELTNGTSATVNLLGFVLRDDGTEQHTIATPLLIAPGGRAILARSNDPVLNGGIVPHYVMQGISLGNGADSIRLHRGPDLVDAVAWDGGPNFPMPVGASLQLDAFGAGPAKNDARGVWCSSASPYGSAGQLGTPGAANPSCPQVCSNGLSEPGEACDDGNLIDGDGCSSSCKSEFLAPVPGSLVITEVMQNPASVADAVGEWFEIQNISSQSVDLLGLVVSDNNASFTITVSYVLEPGQFATLGVNADPSTNGGVPVDLVFSGLQLANASDFVTLSFAGSPLDVVAWDDGVTFPDPNGASMSLDPSASSPIANDLGAAWCQGVGPISGGDLGSPGQPNPPCP